MPLRCKVIRGRTSGGVRRISALDIYTVCPVGAAVESKGATRPGDVEVKGLPVGASVQHSTRKRFAITCGVCEQPVALSSRPLRAGAGFVCQACVDDLSRLVDPFDLPEGAELEQAEDVDNGPVFGTFDDDDDKAPPITAEAAYGAAQDEEREYDVDSNGSPGRATRARDRWPP